jgi:hypothetical protein
MRATVFRYFFSFFLALTLTAQAQASVASSCHAKGLHLTQASIGLHLSPSQAEMHSKHSHGIDSSALHLTSPDESETSSTFVKAKCSYCATGCSMVYLPTTVPVSLPPDLGISDTFVSLVKHYKDALLDGLMRPPRS